MKIMKIMIIRYNERRVVVYYTDERRRPRRGAPAAVQVTKKMLKPSCPAVRRRGLEAGDTRN